MKKINLPQAAKLTYPNPVIIMYTEKSDGSTNLAFDVSDCFEILRQTAQTICPTVVSMVFDVADNMVYWCENKEWNKIEKKKIG